MLNSIKQLVCCNVGTRTECYTFVYVVIRYTDRVLNSIKQLVCCNVGTRLNHWSNVRLMEEWPLALLTDKLEVEKLTLVHTTLELAYQ